MGYTLCVLGCGTMGVSILSGVLASIQSTATKDSSYTAEQEVDRDPSIPSQFYACCSRDVTATKLRNLFQDLEGPEQNIKVMQGKNVEAVAAADIVLLCCKPFMAYDILNATGMKNALDGKLLISVLAGVTIAQMKEWLSPSTQIIRAMPNTPSKIREGMTIVSTTATPLSEIDQARILMIFSSVGRVKFLEEKHFDVCTALSGSGPAFVCLFLEAMADGAVMMGLPRAEALEIAAQTLQGAARMTLQEKVHPAQLRDAVTTPGGTTIAGLLALENGGVRGSIAKCIIAATERATYLGQSAKK